MTIHKILESFSDKYIQYFQAIFTLVSYHKVGTLYEMPTPALD